MRAFTTSFDYKTVTLSENRVSLKSMESVKTTCENPHLKWLFYIADNKNIAVRENVINTIIIYRFYFVYRSFWL